MKKLFLLPSLLLTVMFVNAQWQKQSPVLWSFSAKKLDEKTFEIRMTATLSDKWHVYSQTTPEGGATPTKISFAKNPLVTTDGPVIEMGKLEEQFEPLFGVNVKQYSEKVEFVQKVKLKAAVKTAVNGIIEVMACNAAQCIPSIKQAFSVSLK